MLLFMQDKLSMEDFTHYADVYNVDSDGAAFHNLKQIMESQPSAHVPSLSSSELLVDVMNGMAQKVYKLTSPYKLQDLPLSENQDGGMLIIVELPTTVGLHTKEVLKQIDGILQSVHIQMSSMDAPFTAVYTAKASSKPMGPSVLSSVYNRGRHLLEADAKADSNSSFWNLTDGCLYVYVQSVTFEAYQVKENAQPAIKTYTLPASSIPDPGSSCANHSAKLVVKYSNQTKSNEGELTLSKFEFTMEYSVKQGLWTLDEMSITYQATLGSEALSGENEKVKPSLTSDIYAPSNFSYHCSYQTPFQTNKTEGKPGDYVVQVRMFQLQVQFNDGPFDGPFGQVNDCVGFFTLPIWSALIAMAVLLSVLFFGLCMLTSIDTQDRFDDPKGKTIQVNVND